jgi:hypothetical protein
MTSIHTPFVPAKAGIQGHKFERRCGQNWVPASAGTNGRFDASVKT